MNGYQSSFTLLARKATENALHHCCAYFGEDILNEQLFVYHFIFFFFFSKKKNSFSASREANVTQSTGNGSGGRTKETFWMHPSAEYPVADELTNVALWPHIFPNSILMFFFIYLLFFRRVSNILNFNATDMPESHNCVLNVKWNVTLRAIWFMFLTMVSYSDARLQFTE